MQFSTVHNNVSMNVDKSEYTWIGNTFALDCIDGKVIKCGYYNQLSTKIQGNGMQVS